jgi:hypothetical protein
MERAEPGMLRVHRALRIEPRAFVKGWRPLPGAMGGSGEEGPTAWNFMIFKRLPLIPGGTAT